MKLLSLSGIAILLTICLGCSSTKPQLNFHQTQNVVLTAYLGGKPVQETIIAANSDKLHSVRHILQQDQGYWRKNNFDYAPNLTLRGTNFDANFQWGRIIINCPDSSGQWHQFVHVLSPEAYQQIKSTFADCAVQADSQARTQR